jgi:hypothetical protein
MQSGNVLMCKIKNINMKHLLVLISIFFCTISFSQSSTSGTITVSKTNIAKAVTIFDLIPNFPKNCEIVAYELIATVSKKVIIVTGTKDDAMAQIKKLLNSADIKSKSYLDSKLKQSDGKLIAGTHCFIINN